jgi:hypothetical protein
MTADQYCQSILNREAVDTGASSPIRGVQAILWPVLQRWGGQWLLNVHPSGSFMKGTANLSGTDIDLFISLSETTTESLKDIHDTLFTALAGAGYLPKRQNLSLNIRVSGYSVDLVPGKRQNPFSDDHSLYKRKIDSWTKTNVVTHINRVANSGRTSEIRLLKLWRDQHGLDFPSFYLELTAMNAFTLLSFGTLSENVFTILRYLRDSFDTARVVDPANTNNIISDDLSGVDKAKIKAAAIRALAATSWAEIIR